MSFKLKYEEPVPEAIKRIVTSEIDEALALLKDAAGSGDKVRAVHDTRKNIKKMRAVLRLLEGELGHKTFVAENRFFRDTGRSLSEVRDAEVLLEAFDQLAERLKKEARVSARTITSARRVLFERRDESTQQMFGGTGATGALSETIQNLEDARQRVSNWRIDDADRDTITEGMRKSYEAGRIAMKVAYSHDSQRKHDAKHRESETIPAEFMHGDELFHDWRKRVKDLWYHTMLLRPLWPGVMKQWGSEAHSLSDYLGDEHDLAVLQQTLASHEERLGTKTVSVFVEEIDRRREHLRAEAKGQGERLYAEKPSAYILRVEKYWRAWRE